MSHDWKGIKVWIVVSQPRADGQVTPEVGISWLLDVDTMTDLFALFNPAFFTFSIQPYEESLEASFGEDQ